MTRDDELNEIRCKQDISDPIEFNDVDTVLVFGAGASREYGLPLDFDFLQDAQSSCREFLSRRCPHLERYLEYYAANETGLESTFSSIETTLRWLNFAEKTQGELRKAFSAFHEGLVYQPLSPVLESFIYDRGGNSPHPNDHNFERAFLNFDNSALMLHQIHLAANLTGICPDKVMESWDLIQRSMLAIRQELQALIYEVIRKKDEDTQGQGDACTQKVIQHFFEKKFGDALVAVSFNYDLLVDKAVCQVLSEKAPYWDPEVVYFQLFDPTPRVHRERNLGNQGVYILKPHGSMNWMQTRSKPLEFICSDMKSDSQEPNVQSWKWIDERNLDPVLVPPVLDKFFELERAGVAGHHGRTWTVFFDAMLKAKNWVFLGYSLPPTDFHANWHIQTAAAYRRHRKDLPNVIVVDKSSDGKPCETSLIKTLRRFGIKPDISANGFREYSNNLK